MNILPDSCDEIVMGQKIDVSRVEHILQELQAFGIPLFGTCSSGEFEPL